MVELRWLVKKIKKRIPVNPDSIGGPMMNAVVSAEVLQMRQRPDHISFGGWSEWLDIPVVMEE